MSNTNKDNAVPKQQSVKPKNQQSRKGNVTSTRRNTNKGGNVNQGKNASNGSNTRISKRRAVKKAGQPKSKRASVAVTNKAITTSESWFVGKSNKNVPSAYQATFLPLVNGETAFGELHDSISKATKSVEIICWAFQPSMYFKRNIQSESPPIGELLMERFIQNNVDVKILGAVLDN